MSEKRRVVVTCPVREQVDDILNREGLEVLYFDSEEPVEYGKIRDAVRDAHGLLCMLYDRIDAPLIDSAPNLRVISSVSTGLNHIDLDKVKERGIVVTHTPGILTEATADLAWALLMATARRVVEGDQFCRQGRFKGWRHHLLIGQDIHHSTLGIFGMGRIGSAIARRARGFHMRVIYHNRNRSPHEEEVGAELVEFETLLRESDHLLISAPLTPETQGRFGREEFRLMKPTATLINIGRGPIVKERELAEAIHSGEIWGAGLDVYEREPEIDELLLETPRVVLLPHLGSASGDTRRRMARAAASDLVSVLEGREPTYRAV